VSGADGEEPDVTQRHARYNERERPGTNDSIPFPCKEAQHVHEAPAFPRQKRKAKLARRAERRPEAEKLAYSGQKYRAPEWTPAVFATELAVYETIALSNRQLTNKQVEAAFIELIHQLRDGLSPVPGPDESPVAFAPGNEVAFLKWNIRRRWQEFFEENGKVDAKDLVGILRTLLHSIEAQAWAHGSQLGYVYFLEGFMSRAGVTLPGFTPRRGRFMGLFGW
jgi:hypothetical protein